MFRARFGKRHGLLALDLGTATTRVLALARNAEAWRVVGGAVRAGSVGRDGIPVQIDVARARLSEVLDEAAQSAGVTSRRVIAAIGGTHVRSMRSRGSLHLRTPVVVRASHLEEVLDKAADIGLPRDQEILHVLPTGYCVDGARSVRPPLGVRARRLLVEVAIVTAARPALDNLVRVLADLGYELVDAAAEPLVAAGAATTPEDRRHGAVMVDLGAERIGALVYRDDVLRGLACLGAGVAHASRDLAWALRCDLAQAESLKRALGVACVAVADPACTSEFLRAGSVVRANQRLLARVIEPRLRELLGLVRDRLDAASARSRSDRVVLTGGGARMPGIVDLAEDVFDAPARVAPPHHAGIETSSTGLGLVAYATRNGLEPDGRGWSGAVQRLRRVLGASAVLRARAGADGPVAVRSVHVPPRAGVDLEVPDVRVRTRV